tara:strand:- start:293 stop:685 length:393 start_codon:yes stop_codon:yes gene_type:complete
MGVEKRGRPKKQTNTFDVNGLLTEFITTKVDKYDNWISYYKVIDKNYKTKMSGILKEVCDECVMPFWKTEDHEYMLKVKKKNTPKTIIDNGDIVTLNLMFKYYCMEKDDGLIQGYYAKILSYDDDEEKNN